MDLLAERKSITDGVADQTTTRSTCCLSESFGGYKGFTEGKKKACSRLIILTTCVNNVDIFRRLEKISWLKTLGSS